MPPPQITLALGQQFRVEQVWVDGSPAPHQREPDLLVVPRRLRAGEEVVVAVRYAREGGAALLPGGDLIDPRGIYLRPESRWYPSTGELDFYAPVQITARVPRGFTVVCAGELVRQESGATETYSHWQSKQPVRMLCLAAGKYVRSRKEAGGTILETCLQDRHARWASTYLTEAARILRFYEEAVWRLSYAKLSSPDSVFQAVYGSSSLLLLTGGSSRNAKIPVSFLAR